MEIVGAFVAEVTQCMSIFLFRKISTLVSLHGNMKSLQSEIQKLISRKNELEEDIRLAITEGKNPTSQALNWIKRVEEIEHDVQLMMEDAGNSSVCGSNLDCCMHSGLRLRKTAKKKCGEVKQLLIDSCTLHIMVLDRKPPIKPVENMTAPSLAGQKAAEEMLEELLRCLNDGAIKRIAVWGMGGIGKTTLVKNFNNLLESPPLMQSFDVVIWVTVSKDLDLRRVQSRIAERLNLEFDVGESTEGRAIKLHETLMKTRFLLILDDVWEKLDLDIVGIPQDDEHAECKILLTTRNLDVCRGMMTTVNIKMDVLNEAAAWNLFAESAGDVVELEVINPLARAIARRCCGLPLAIKTMGSSMRSKNMVELWENVLCQLQHSTLHVRSVMEEVYLPLNLSYISLPSKIHRCCFLYCSLYPENFSIEANEVIQCWIADGLIDDHQTLEQSFNYGISLIENLKDSCMLEQGEGVGTVRMHGLARDMAIWTSIETGFFCQAGTLVSVIPQKLQKSLTKISFMNCNITRIPSQLFRCSRMTVLLLQGNPLEKIPDNLFREVRALRVLNLSGTLIKSLPSTLLHLVQLRAFLVRDCCYLEKLPLFGDLCELQMLDLSGTRLRELPWKRGMLGNLRYLNLSHTLYLENIETGTLRGLSSLEALDMSSSAYKWDAMGNVGEPRAAFDELLSLQKLSVLHLRLDSANCLTLESDWLKRFRKFNIRISPRSCHSNYPPTQHDEKRVILRGVDLMTGGLEGLFCNASALDLVNCGGMDNLSEVVVRHNLHGLSGLKSLTISSCDWITSLINGETILRSMLPNLEHLKLRRLKNLSAILEGIVPKRGCLGMLKTLEVVDCGRLEKQLISFSFLRQLKNLEEIKVGECRRIKRLIAGSASNSELPKLKIIEMWDMVNLKGVCTRTVHLPVLERIGVSNCSLLVKLPITAYNAAAIKEIRGALEWWNNITWQDYEIKSLVQRRFQACAVSTSLGKEERSIILHLKQLFSLFPVLKLFLLIIDCFSIFKKNVVS